MSLLVSNACMLIRVLNVTKTTQTLFSEGQLAKFDGTIEHFGIYIAVRIFISYLRRLNDCFIRRCVVIVWQIDHDVYDVTSNRRTYGPGGSYAIMCVPSYSIHVYTEYQPPSILVLRRGAF
jgi:hypothetical protein